MITPAPEKPKRPVGLTIGDEPLETFVKDPPVEKMPGPFRSHSREWLLWGGAALAAGVVAYFLISGSRRREPRR